MGKLKLLGVFLISLVFYYWLNKRFLFDFIYSRMGRYCLFQTPFPSILIILAASIFTSMVYIQISRKQFHSLFVWSFGAVYVCAAVYIFLGRHIVFRGIELNPLAFIYYWGQPRGGIKNILNIVFFVPYGILLHRTPLKRLVPFSLIGLILLEALQYVLSVGVFDLSDVLLNSIGFYLGYCTGKFFARKGVKMVNSLRREPEDLAFSDKES